MLKHRGCAINIMLIIVLKPLSTFVFLPVAGEYALNLVDDKGHDK